MEHPDRSIVCLEERMSTDAFEAILKEMLEIRTQKRMDYSRPYADARGDGLANLITTGWEGVVVRLRDKIDRLNGFALQSLIEGKTQATNEPVEDAFLDAANYAVLGLILYRQNVSWRKDGT